MGGMPTFDAKRMLSFDLETTSANPREARIVTSALVRIDGRDVTATEHLAGDPDLADSPDLARSVRALEESEQAEFLDKA